MHLHFSENTVETVLTLFVLITFFQSGFDKLIDWKGNLSWLKGHFSKTIFRNAVPILLAIVTILEIVTGILALMGLVHLLLHDQEIFVYYAALFGSLTLLILLLGQRIAKDYEGAKTIVIYLIATCFLLFLVQ